MALIACFELLKTNQERRASLAHLSSQNRGFKRALSSPLANYNYTSFSCQSLFSSHTVIFSSSPTSPTPNCSTMFDSTLELFTLAASNSLLVFGLCNLIIIILFFSGPKPSSQGTQDSFNCAYEVPKRIEREEIEALEESTLEDIEATSSSADVPQEANSVKSSTEEIIRNVATEESDNEDECIEEEDDDDELRRKVEEFIEKVNRGWKAEKLMTLDLNRSPIW